MRNPSTCFLVVAAVLASCSSAPVAEVPVRATASPAPRVQEKPTATAMPVSIKLFKASGAPAGAITTVYSPQGLVARQQVFSSAGVLISVRTGSVSDGGWRVVEASAKGAVLSIEDRTLGPKGELASITLRDARELPVSVTEYQYDAAGRLSAAVCRAGDGRLRTRTVYSYDGRGNNSKIEVFDASGALNTVFERQFEGGRVVVERAFDSSGTLVELTKTAWKGARKLSQETVTPVSRLVEYSYESTDAPVALVRSVRGQVVERQTIEYQWLTR